MDNTDIVLLSIFGVLGLVQLVALARSLYHGSAFEFFRVVILAICVGLVLSATVGK